MSQPKNCAECGQGLGAEDAFCWNCGTTGDGRDQTRLQERRDRLSDSSIVDGRCRSCNGPLRNIDTFCSECGVRREATQNSAAGPGKGEGYDKLRAKLVEVASDEFEILDELGRGGMGAVYLARDRHLQRPVAIKVLFPRFLADDSMLERFRNEARIVAALRHPSIVNLHAVRNRDELHFFIMDFISGASLEQVIRSQPPLSLEVFRSILYQVGSALAYAHRQGRGVIHRDIKPSNIMLDGDGNAVVMDFGISKAVSRSQGLTMTGAIIGTPEYMSPEQCRGDALTIASDQYALGLVAYCMLTGSPPFSGHHMTVLLAHLSDQPAPIGDRRPDIPDDIEAAIMKMLSKDPKDRFPDLSVALRALDARSLEHGDPIKAAIGDLVHGAGGGMRTATPVAEVSLPSLPKVVVPGDRFALAAVPIDELGKELQGRDVVWSSTNPDIISITADGSLQAHQEGKVILRASCEGTESTFEIIVTPSPIKDILVSPAPGEVRPGDRFQLAATVLDSHGQPKDGVEVAWSSSSPSVAFVSSDGIVEAVAQGDTQLVAEAGGVRGTLELRVLERGVASIWVSQPPAVIHPGVEFRLESAALDDRGQRLDGRVVAWDSSNPETVQVTPDGLVRALVSGAANVRASCGGQEAVIQVVVTRPPVSGVEVTAPPATIRPGDDFVLTATPRDESGTALVDRGVTWSTSDPSVAFVSSSGRVEAVGTGLSRIYAECEGQRTEIAIEVGEPVVASIWVPMAPGVVHPGETFHLEPAVLDGRGQRVEGKTVLWEASPKGVVEVSEEGRVLAVGDGTVTILARCESASAEIEVTVKSRTISGLSATAIMGPDEVKALEQEVVQSKAQTEPTPTVEPAKPTEPPLLDPVWPAATDPAQTESKHEPEPEPALGLGAFPPPIGATEILGRVDPAPLPPPAHPAKRPEKAKPTPKTPADTTSESDDEESKSKVGIWVGGGVGVVAVALIAMLMGGGDDVTPADPVGQTPAFQPAAAGLTLDLPETPVLRVGEVWNAVARDGDGQLLSLGSVSFSTQGDGALVQAGLGSFRAEAAGSAIVIASLGDVADTIRFSIEEVTAVDNPVVTEPPVNPTPTDTGTPEALASISIVGDTGPLDQGARRQFRISARTQGGGNYSFQGTDVRWSATPSAGLDVGGSTGLAVGGGAGSVRLTATLEGQSASVTVQVRAVPSDIEISNVPGALQVGDQSQLQARVRDRNGAAMSGDVRWSSSDPSVVAVGPSTGQLTGGSAGRANITATLGAIASTVTVQVAEASATPTPPVATGPATPTEADARQAVTELWDLIEQRDMSGIRTLIGSDALTGDLEDFVDDLEDNDLAGNSTGALTFDGSTVDFEILIERRGFSGAAEVRTARFRATLGRTGQRWRLTEIQLLGM